MKVAIIGAGPAGLSAGYYLSKNKIEVDIYESSAFCGGMARTIELWGQRVDIGPHRFFSANSYVNELWHEVIEDQFLHIKRLTRIFYKGKFIRYPLSLPDMTRQLGILEGSKAMISFLFERSKFNGNPDNFEQWACQKFGPRVYELFLRHYSEKLWGIACSELDCEFAHQRIRKLSLWAVLSASLRRKMDAQHRSLINHFPYPLQGAGALYEKMAEKIKAFGGKIHFKQAVDRAIVHNNKVRGISFADGSIKEYDHVISSMPLTLLVKSLHESPESVRKAAAGLSFRSTILVYLLIKGANPFPDQWMYIQSPDLEMGRITNFRNWSPELCKDNGDTILCCEYWANEEDSVWLSEDSYWINKASGELLKIFPQLTAESVKNAQVVKIPKCYPIYRLGYRNHLDQVKTYLDSLSGLSVIGRYGAFKYNNQDHSILMGIKAARNLIFKENNDIWGVNNETQHEEEGAFSSSN